DGDELFSHYDVRALLAGEAWPPGVRSHPLGYALMAASVAGLGEGAGALRLPSALAGLAAVAALLLLRRDALPAGEALVAGALAALSPWLIYHSQEARFYGPLFLLATLATLWALPGPRQKVLPALAAALLAALCHPSALLLLPSLGVLLCSGGASPARVRRVLAGAGLAVACALLLGGRALYDNVLAAVVRRGHADYDAPHFVAGLGYNLGVGAGALVLAALPAVWKSPRPGERALLLCAALPPALLLVLGLLGVSVQQRYALVAVPAALLLAGRGLLACAGRRALAAALAAAALLAPLPELYAYAGSGDRHDFRAAAEWLASHAKPEDIVVADEHSIVDLYLAGHPGWERPLLHEAPLGAKFMREFPYDRRQVWVVVKRNRLRGAYGADFSEWIGRHFVPVAEVGAPPPPLARHDNVLSIFRRRERLRG
ncbi:MAG TPA: glycosyltransferase family 39 protein, partial [Planctomycetota bacterium]|nr:glycosyltransferase family 39 protein [Planctomycetota bacterium]